MSKPIPGQQYTVQESDVNLESIASRAYGDKTKWTLISNANQSTLKSTNSEDISPGQILNIPVIAENETFKTANRNVQLKNKEDDELTIIANNKEILVVSARIFTAMDHASHGWSFKFAWEMGDDQDIDNICLPFTYPKGAVYIGGNLIVNGIIYTSQPELTVEGSLMTLEGWSYTADIIDSNLKPPYERSKITLKELAESLVKPFGINVIYDVEGDEFFDRVTAGKTETIFRHLAELASQRGILITATASGDLLFTRSKPSRTVGTLSEGEIGIENFKARFDGRSRYSIYKVTGQSPFKVSKSAIAEDSRVPRSRFKTFSFNDTTEGNIQDAANWRRSKAVADALTIQIPVTGWKAPDNSIWKTNTLLTVISKTLFVSQGFTFLIRAVEFILDENGKSAVLSLVPKEVYTKEDIIDPWSIAS